MRQSLVLPARGQVVATRLLLARTPAARMRGLIGRPLDVGEALLLCPCRQVHTFWMRYAIDAVFCDRHLNVVHVVREMHPRRVSTVRWDASCVIELEAGAANAVRVGDGLRIVPAGTDQSGESSIPVRKTSPGRKSQIPGAS